MKGVYQVEIQCSLLQDFSWKTILDAEVLLLQRHTSKGLGTVALGKTEKVTARNVTSRAPIITTVILIGSEM